MSSRSPTRVISRKRSRWHVVCNRDVTTWTAVVCLHRVGWACWSPRFSTRMSRTTCPPQRQRLHRPYKISKPINSIYRSVPVRPALPTAVQLRTKIHTSKFTAMAMMKSVASRFVSIMIGSWFPARANAGDQITLPATFDESQATEICSRAKSALHSLENLTWHALQRPLIGLTTDHATRIGAMILATFLFSVSPFDFRCLSAIWSSHKLSQKQK